MFLLLAIIIFIIYIICDNNFLWINRKKITDKRIPKDFKNTKIIHLSDLHNKLFGKNNKYLLRKIEREKPDFIIFTGDIISRQTKSLDRTEKLLKALAGIAPVYCCFGNHELDLPAAQKEKLINIIKSAKINLLIDKSEKIVKNKSYINIAGICPKHECYKNADGSYKNLKPYTPKDIEKALGIHSDKYTILLAHNPIFFPTYAHWGAELIFSGHVHGGIVRIPFVCGFLSPERKLFPKYTSGIYRLKNSVMVLSRGLGKLRLFNPPQIIIITLD